MASFLPGVGGLWGIPMWSFYVNRGQGMATFGIENKEGGLLLFQTAEKAYQVTPFVGFRTLIKGQRADGSTFEAQPFFPESDADKTTSARRDMFIGNNEMEVEESDPLTGIRTNALYFTIPEEVFPALVRRVSFTNEGSAPVELEVVDGLAKLEPAGTDTRLIDTIGRTIEGWMHVFNFQDDHTVPFFHLVSAPADTADVRLIKDGHFAVAFIEDDQTVGKDGAHALLPMLCDAQLLFGTDTSLTVPRNFFSSANSPNGATLDELRKAPQSTTSRTPSAFATAAISLKPGESKTLSIVYGHAADLDKLLLDIVPTLKAKGYIAAKRADAQVLGDSLTSRVSMSSGVPLMDNYAKQNYLDNSLRGGMPIDIGTPAGMRPKIFHAFSRIHGDLERDYNNFEIEQTFWSQGPGNFRDVNQNRRCDVLQQPSMGDFNVRQFLSFVQADGYNQLTVATAFFKIFDTWRIDQVVAQITPPGSNQQKAKELLSQPFRPGQLFHDLAAAGIKVYMEKMRLLELVTQYADQVPAGQFPASQNGFWTDHFAYYLDLVHNFVSVYPDQEEKMLYDAEPVPFFLSPGRVANRTEKNMLASENTVRQYDAVRISEAKTQQLQIMYGQPQYVGDAQAGGSWQRTAKGEVMTVSVVAKLVILAANKFSILDPLGMGIEMEAGKPGWNDAMNGLPALFGSEMPSAYELHEIVDYVGDAVDRFGRSVVLPEEASRLLEAIDKELGLLASGASSDFDFWDKVHDSLEAYRTATDATFSGVIVEWTAHKLGKATGIFGRMLRRMDAGIERALSRAPPSAKGVSPTYFRFNVKDFTVLGVSDRGLPTVKIQAYEEPEAMPLFLEGPTRRLKTLKAAEHSEKLAVYTAVQASPLHDTELAMYKISESLIGQPFEIGRMMSFNPGWLENESIWLHMSYKWYLELLRAGLYAEFFKEIKKGVVCFMDSEVMGRSPLEASSFIVSSAFPDKALHGSGFLARLSGTTAEFLSMWNHMMAGPSPFTLAADGTLQLSLQPVISTWMWREDGMLTFSFLGAVQVTYVSASKHDSWASTISRYELTTADGTQLVEGAVVPAPLAEQVRNLKFSKIKVTLK
uniref:Cellobiose phosphorylase n=1 Tax=Coccolithus braarudii TaxID=221442 RepID=A0A7S0PZ02_9EUKA